MTISRDRLRKIIAEELGRGSVRKVPSLTSVLFEDIADDIERAYNDGPGAVRNLVNTTTDKKGLKSALQGAVDGEDADDKIDVGSGKFVEVGNLLPTQKEIDLMKSAAYPLASIDAIKYQIKNGRIKRKGTISVSGNLILDGHHRWSGTWAISGAKGKIAVQDFGFEGNQDQKLAAAQLAVAAANPNLKGEQPAAKGDIPYNILGKNKSAIKKMILDNVGKQTDPSAPGALLNDKYVEQAANEKEIADWAGFKVGASKDEVIDKIAEKVADNLGALPNNPDAPARPDMPQLDAPEIGGEEGKNKIVKATLNGRYNVQPPFKKEESVASRDNTIMERWNKLAGLIK